MKSLAGSCPLIAVSECTSARNLIDYVIERARAILLDRLLALLIRASQLLYVIQNSRIYFSRSLLHGLVAALLNGHHLTKSKFAQESIVCSPQRCNAISASANHKHLLVHFARPNCKIFFAADILDLQLNIYCKFDLSFSVSHLLSPVTVFIGAKTRRFTNARRKAQ